MYVGYEEVNRGYREILFGLGDRFNRYREGSNDYEVRFKPYRDCVKKKLKWRFFFKNGTLTRTGVL